MLHQSLVALSSLLDTAGSASVVDTVAFSAWRTTRKIVASAASGACTTSSIFLPVLPGVGAVGRDLVWCLGGCVTSIYWGGTRAVTPVGSDLPGAVDVYELFNVQARCEV